MDSVDCGAGSELVTDIVNGIVVDVDETIICELFDDNVVVESKFVLIDFGVVS